MNLRKLKLSMIRKNYPEEVGSLLRVKESVGQRKDASEAIIPSCSEFDVPDWTTWTEGRLKVTGSFGSVGRIFEGPERMLPLEQ